MSTKLKAINTMLSAISEAPVNSLDSGLPEAEIALNILDEINEAVQSEGWTFNTELDLTLPSTREGLLPLPDNYLEVDLTNNPANTTRFVVRGQKIYDRLNHTFTITEEVIADVIILLPFEELPQTARTYITVKAARILQDRVLGSDAVHRFTRTDEEYSRLALKKTSVRKSGRNLSNNPTVHSVLNRRI